MLSASNNLAALGMATVFALVLSSCSTIPDPANRVIWNRPDVSDSRRDLYRQCFTNSDIGHFPPSANRRRLRDSSAYKKHVSRLREFCRAYAGSAPSRFWLSINNNGNAENGQMAFLLACQEEASRGRSVLFSLKPEHVEGIKSICTLMSKDLP